MPGLINLDFADVRTVMTEMGKAMMGTGEASGEGRALMAAENAIQNPLLDEVTLKGAKAVLVNITGGDDMTLLEVDEAANAISGQVDPEANIIFGAAFDPTLEGMVRVSVVATGMDGASIAAIDTLQPRRREAVAPVQEFTSAAPAPVAADFEPAYAKTTTLEPVAFRALEPEPVMAAATVAQPDFGFEPAAKPTSVVQVVPRIVDPAGAEADDEPLFASPHYSDDRARKGGWLSLFGRPRHEAPQQRPAPARSVGGGGAQVAAEPLDDADAEDREDLEIPSFLRRLAN